MLTVAVTGGIGSGKTAACNIFASLGAPVIDTDLISRQLVEPGQPALSRITELFGHDLLLADGQLDRKKMRSIIFADQQARESLEAILHPLIHQLVKQQLFQLNHPYAIIVIPLLLETRQLFITDRILVIDSPENLQRSRVLSRDNIEPALFERMLQAQASRQQRLSVADDIICNDGDMDHLQEQVKTLHRKYTLLGQAK